MILRDMTIQNLLYRVYSLGTLDYMGDCLYVIFRFYKSTWYLYLSVLRERSEA